MAERRLRHEVERLRRGVVWAWRDGLAFVVAAEWWTGGPHVLCEASAPTREAAAERALVLLRALELI